jgi:hypothetical protein
MGSKNWMAGVKKGISHRGTKGVFKEAAARAGKSTSEFAQEHKHDSGKTGNRARLALAFASARRG